MQCSCLEVLAQNRTSMLLLTWKSHSYGESLLKLYICEEEDHQQRDGLLEFSELFIDLSKRKMSYNITKMHDICRFCFSLCTPSDHKVDELNIEKQDVKAITEPTNYCIPIVSVPKSTRKSTLIESVQEKIVTFLWLITHVFRGQKYFKKLKRWFVTMKELHS